MGTKNHTMCGEWGLGQGLGYLGTRVEVKYGHDNKDGESHGKGIATPP